MGENVPTHVTTLDAGHYGCMEHNWAPGNGYSGITRGRTGTSEDMSGMASGGDRGTRTPNLRDANAALSHLSYIPAARATGGSGGRFTIGPGRRHGQGVGPSPPWPWPSAAPPAPTAKPPLPRNPSGLAVTPSALRHHVHIRAPMVDSQHGQRRLARVSRSRVAQW